ncbi:MAG: glycoside hydrolase family 28 protein [Bacteroidetes bacterium]|nr:glycoside hydrolase family 28 protein [Bacteroidota bacterium]
MKLFCFLLLLGFVISIQSKSQDKTTSPIDIIVIQPTFPEKYFSVEDFGAKEGGVEKCTQAFADAINKATKSGGGYVTVPKGKWLVGPIVLKDNVCIKFEEGTEILFSTDTEDYLPAVLSRHQGIDCYKHSAFIYANGATNIGVIGKAVLHGQGKTWWDYRNAIPKSEDPFVTLMEMAEKDVPLSERVFDDINKTLLAPCFIMPIYCKNILIEDITVKYGAYWTVNPVYSENIIVRNVTVQTIGEYGKTGNGDGINLSSCKNVLVEGCWLNTGDDCITIKSGRGIDGYKKAVSCENIEVRNCESLKGHGGVVIGSETSGGVRNIYVHDCVFNGTDRGLRIKTARGRGEAIENIWFEDVKMGSMVKEAIKIHMPRYTDRYPAHPLTRMTPRIRNMNLRNIQCEHAGEYAIRIQGLPEMPIESITMEDINVKSEQGILLIDAAAILIKNINVEPKEDAILTFDNSSNIIIENMGKSDKTILVKGKGSKEIRLVNSKLNRNKVVYEDCKNEVSFLISESTNNEK